MEVNAPKTVSINKTVQQVINPGQWVLIRFCLLVQSPIIYAHPEGSIFFRSKKYGGPIRRGAGPDPALAKVLMQLYSNLSKFYRRHSVLPLSRWYGVRQQVNPIFNSSLRVSAWLLKKPSNPMHISSQWEESVPATLVLSSPPTNASTPLVSSD